jgi:Xaa-Pro aminopeptidase
MTVIENEEILMPLRYVKTTDELAAIRRAAEAADKGIEAATAAIKPGITEIRWVLRLNMLCVELERCGTVQAPLLILDPIVFTSMVVLHDARLRTVI